MGFYDDQPRLASPETKEQLAADLGKAWDHLLKAEELLATHARQATNAHLALRKAIQGHAQEAQQGRVPTRVRVQSST